ncbi:MAG: DNA repair protein RecN [Acidobacteriia bacterium]|nr:DNA repair protein RecN [Terriglobia bacterium]MBV8903369.1 DNA repair protein RecN [Terriglobia bacterium]
MLRELVVENYAVIERARVSFHCGLNLLTGETGSGKSMVVDAFALLLGGRASADTVRRGTQRARIAGIFEVREHQPIAQLLEAAGIQTEDGELLIEREILPEGKSRAYIGSRPVAASLLRELAPHLADIHGQHDQQLLLLHDAQRDMLDAFAGAGALLTRVAAAYRQSEAAGKELDELERSEQERLRLADLWEFQRKEIESTELAAGEDAALEDERRILLNVQRLEEAAGAAYAALYDSPESALTLTRTAAKRVDEVCRIDSKLEPAREHLKAAALSLEEASYALRDYLGRLEANPARQEEIESRLAAIDRLKRKYGHSVAEILDFIEQVRARLSAVERSGDRIDQLRAERQKFAAEFEKSAAELSRLRQTAGARLAKQVEAELSHLAMEPAAFRLEITPAAWSASGADRIEFLVAANTGDPPRPLDRVASGGELSRIALALKTCLSASPMGSADGTVRTLVFDEVDTGVGGSAAEGIGRRLKRLAASNQVFCVTHLPQIASFADHHYRVEKREIGGRTIAEIEELDAAGRTREIGRMLSGHKLTAEALKHAEQLIRMSAG